MNRPFVCIALLNRPFFCVSHLYYIFYIFKRAIPRISLYKYKEEKRAIQKGRFTLKKQSPNESPFSDFSAVLCRGPSTNFVALGCHKGWTEQTSHGLGMSWGASGLVLSRQKCGRGGGGNVCEGLCTS